MAFRQYLWEMMKWWQAVGAVSWIKDSGRPRAREEPGQGRLVARCIVSVHQAWALGSSKPGPQLAYPCASHPVMGLRAWEGCLDPMCFLCNSEEPRTGHCEAGTDSK